MTLTYLFSDPTYQANTVETYLDLMDKLGVPADAFDANPSTGTGVRLNYGRVTREVREDGVLYSWSDE